MKKIVFVIVMLAIVAGAFSSCKKEDCNCVIPLIPVAVATGYLNQPELLLSSSVQQYIPCGSTGAFDATNVTYHFSAEESYVNITEISFSINETNSVTSLKIGNNTAVVANGYANFYGLNLLVPLQGGLNLRVDISYSGIGPIGLNSGTGSSVTMTSVTYIAKYGQPDGISRNVVRTIPINVPASPAMVLVGSIPHLTVLQPISKINIGETEVADVQISADSKGDIALNDVVFFVSTSGAIKIDGYIVKDELNNVVGTISLKDPGFILRFNSGYVILAGQTKVFKIFALVTSLGVAGTEAPVISTMLFEYGFMWTDIAGYGVNGGCDASLLYGFPTNMSIIKN
jgi:hypothetical protein